MAWALLINPPLQHKLFFSFFLNERTLQGPETQLDRDYSDRLCTVMPLKTLLTHRQLSSTAQTLTNAPESVDKKEIPVEICC